MILGVHGLVASSISGFDADAAAFFARVTTAGGSLSATEQTAVNTLVVQMKADGIWSKMKAVYPMVGASAAACAQNLKSSSFTGTFTSGWTYASTGITANNSYMDTNLNTNTNLNVNNFAISFYTLSNLGVQTVNKAPYGNASSASYSPIIQCYLRGTAGTYISDMGDFNYRVSGANTSDTRGFYINTRTANNVFKVFKNNTLFGSNTGTQPQTTLPNNNLPLGGFNDRGTYTNKGDLQFNFFSISDGLTDTEASDFYTAVQAFQTTLSRQV